MVLFILGVLALILLMGNAYLYFFPFNNKNETKSNAYYDDQTGEWEKSINNLSEKNTEFEKRIITHERAVSRKLKTIDTSITNLNSKAEDTVKRIGRLESISLARKNTLSPDPAINEKIDRLEDFRRNTTIEIQAIKEIIPELKKKKITTPTPEMEKKIHNLIYHGKLKK